MSQSLNQLKDALRHLKPAGHEGFEGLVKIILEALTGFRFHLARAGTQEGRDLSTAGTYGTWIAVEAKHYPKSPPPTKRTFLGHLTETRNDIPELDLWVLVASTAIPDQTATALTQEGNDQGIAIQILDWNENGTPDLAVLCAAAPTVTTDFLTAHCTAPQQIDKITKELETLASAPGFDNAVNRIKQEFSAAHIGYDHAKQAAHHYLTKSMTSGQEAKTNLLQLLDLKNPAGNLIPRTAATNFLNNWWEKWTETPGPAVLLGEEGNGKTWAAMAWWQTLANNAPLTLFIPAGRNPELEPDDLIITELERHTGIKNTHYWNRRLEGWRQRPPGETPQLLLIIDGLNEQPRKKWARLFTALDTNQNRGRVAVIATCRNRYWNSRIDLPDRNSQASMHTIEHYDESEFSQALDEFDLTPHDLSPALNEALRKPRLFRIARGYLKRGKEINAVTIEQLYFDDWKDRYDSKTNLNLTRDEFNQLLRKIARGNRTGTDTYEGEELRRIMAGGEYPAEDFINDFQELLDGNLITRDDDNQFQISEHLLPHALGHLLTHEARQASNPEEVIANYLEPYDGTDFAIAVRRSAAILVILLNNYPQEAKIALWKEWFSSHNQRDDSSAEILGIADEQPGFFLDLAETYATTWRSNYAAARHLERALQRVAERKHDTLTQRFKKWLGIINTEGSTFQRQPNSTASKETKNTINQRITELAQSETVKARVSITTADDDGHEWLSRVALRAISTNPQPGFADAIIAWALSRATMGFPKERDEVSWILRHSHNGSENLFTEVQQRAHELAAINNPVAHRAAATLFQALGSTEAHEARRNLPKEITAPALWWIEKQKDPCHGLGRWKREHLATCLERSDIKMHQKLTQLESVAIDPSVQPPRSFIKELCKLPIHNRIDKIRSGRMQTKADLDYETAEPVLAAYDSASLARLTQALVNDLPERGEEAQFLLAFEINEYVALVDDTARETIEACWAKLNDDKPGRDGQAAEAYLTRILLAKREAEEQLALLLGRPEHAHDRLDFARLFLPLNPERYETLLHGAAGTPSTIRCRRILWFLSAHDLELTPQGRQHLVRLLQHDDSCVRALVLKLIANADDAEAAQTAVDSGWAWTPDDDRQRESWHGSRCLAMLGTRLSFVELRARVEPGWLGRAVHTRGSRPEEIAAYAQTIDQVWNAARSPNEQHEPPPIRLLYEPDVVEPDGFPRPRILSVEEAAELGLDARRSYWEEPLTEKLQRAFTVLDPDASAHEQERLHRFYQTTYKEQAQAGLQWLGRFSAESLAEVVHQHPDLVKKWVNAVVSAAGRTINRSLLFYASQFYQQLCLVLLSASSAQGERLWHALTSNSLYSGSRNLDIDYRVHMLFIADDNPCVTRLRNTALDHATTDHELFGLLVAAQAHGRNAWIQERIAADQRSGSIWRAARALTITGFTHAAATSGEPLGNYDPDDQDWLSVVAGAADHLRQRDMWAQHWYQEFQDRPDREGAFAAFRLFLRCVDRRYWNWDEQQPNHELPAWKRVHLVLNGKPIEDAMQRNEKDLASTLYYTKIARGTISPWLDD